VKKEESSSIEIKKAYGLGL